MLYHPNENRPARIVRALLMPRDRPDLWALARETSPQQFVWRILPHAARSFAASIVVLPSQMALASAVAYLYCRMLDTYEDLHTSAHRVERLEDFGERFDCRPLSKPEPISPALAVDDLDRLHILLVDRCHHVDAVFESLPPETQCAITELVRSMAAGMAWSIRVFDRQGGALVEGRQVVHYCHHVMGNPVAFAMRLATGRELAAELRDDAMAVGELIQFANITRDIERDLIRGIAYHPDLEPYLGGRGESPKRQEAVRRVREEFLLAALRRIPAYRRMMSALGNRPGSGLQLGGVLTLLFTDLHYRRCATQIGYSPWPGPHGRLGTVARALPALVSPLWTRTVLARTERTWLHAAARLGPQAAAGFLPSVAET